MSTALEPTADSTAEQTAAPVVEPTAAPVAEAAAAPSVPSVPEARGSQVAESVARDAQDFGAYAKTGGWTFALKVARSVRPGGAVAGEEAEKVSAKEFARLAGCSPERVMRFWRAWDAAADDGLVPVFEALRPGADVELPDADVWLSYYTSRSSGSSPRGHAISAVAEAEGIRPTKALEVAENPTALRAAILADPATAQAAKHALMDRLEDDPALAAELARDIGRTDGLKKAVAAESKVADRLEFVRQVVETGEVRTPGGQKIPAPEPVVAEARQHLALLEDLADDEMGGYAADAYGALQTMVVEAVEADPQLRAHDRRARFRAKVQKAAKAFEELTLDDAAAVYEEEMLEQLETLQAAIASCIAELRRAGGTAEAGSGAEEGGRVEEGGGDAEEGGRAEEGDVHAASSGAVASDDADTWVEDGSTWTEPGTGPAAG